MHTRPWNIFPSQRPQHNPRSVATTEGHGETATGSDRRTSIRGNCGRSHLCHGIGILIYFELHWSFSIQCDNSYIGCDIQPELFCKTRLVRRLGRQRGNLPGPSWSDLAILRRVKLFPRPHSGPTHLFRIHRWECPLSAPDLRFATPLPHSPHGQTVWGLRPSRRPARVRTHPSHRDGDDGWPPSLLSPLSAPRPEPELWCPWLSSSRD